METSVYTLAPAHRPLVVADIVVTNGDDEPVIVVEVKARAVATPAVDADTTAATPTPQSLSQASPFASGATSPNQSVTVSVTPAVDADATDQLSSLFASAPATVRFGLLIGLDKAFFFERDAESVLMPVLELVTTNILREYEPHFGNKKIYEFYLIGLVEAWLNDVAYRWKNAHPPHLEELEKAGIAQAIRGGSTQLEVKL